MINNPVDRRSIGYGVELGTGSQVANGLSVWLVPAVSVSRSLIRGCSLIADRCADRLTRVFRACQRSLGVFVEDLPARRICDSLKEDLSQFIGKTPWADKMTHVDRLLSKAIRLQPTISVLSPDMRSTVYSQLQTVLRVFSLELHTYVKILEEQLTDRGPLVSLERQRASSLLPSVISGLSQLQDSIVRLLAIAGEEGFVVHRVLQRCQDVCVLLSQQHTAALDRPIIRSRSLDELTYREGH